MMLFDAPPPAILHRDRVVDRLFEDNCAVRAKLFNGDCYDLLPALAPLIDRARAACVTDPPYQFDTSGGGIMRKNRDYMDKIEDAQIADGFDDRMLNPSLFSAVVVFCHDNQAPQLWTRLRARYRRAVLCQWRKTNPMPVCNRAYVSETEIYFHAWTKGMPPQGDAHTLKQIWDGAVGKSEFDHPTVKPLALMEKILANVGAEIIIDPFMGTGTTGVAAIRQGRAFIGIEKNPAFFEIAAKRLAEAAEARG